MHLHNPSHPGEVLRDISQGLVQADLASRLGVTRQTLSRILNGHASVTASMALRLSKAFPNSTPEMWLKLQMQYDLWQARYAAKPIRSASRRKATRTAVAA
ncbi:HigA family addiction module antitoxin [Terriglobus sp.]|uniref:HigA family addiction module antitoxin n=1 Tax=Terriglobus sp. TaxID=1889013 RepID=UPI003B00D884